MINRFDIFLPFVDLLLEFRRQGFVANVHVVAARPVEVDKLDLNVLIEQDILGPKMYSLQWSLYNTASIC